jgi:hypothetical protein
MKYYDTDRIRKPGARAQNSNLPKTGHISEMTGEKIND